MTILLNARAAFSQDSEDSAAGIDASLEGTAPAVDEDAKSADRSWRFPS